jgi:hypothetical protein
MQSWTEMDEFRCVDLQDTFIYSWAVADGALTFEVLVSLWPGHPRYEEPANSHYTCFRKGSLKFFELASIDGLAKMTEVSQSLDLDGTVDYGCFYFLGYDGNERYVVSGDFGEVKLRCAGMEFRIY